MKCHKHPTRRERDAKSRAELSDVAWQIREFIRQHGQGEMSATAWLEALNRQAPDVCSDPEFPKYPALFSRRLQALKAGLSALNVEVSSTRSGARGRLIRIESADHAKARCHFTQEQTKREIMRKESERQERQLIYACRSPRKPLQRPTWTETGEIPSEPIGTRQKATNGEETGHP